MKLLFDEMLSDRLPGLLADMYPGSAHIFDVGLVGRADRLVWEHAKNYDFIVTSKDKEYLDLSNRLGSPP